MQLSTTSNSTAFTHMSFSSTNFQQIERDDMPSRENLRKDHTSSRNLLPPISVPFPTLNTAYAQYPYPPSLASPPPSNLSSAVENIQQDNTSCFQPMDYSQSTQSQSPHYDSLTPPTTPWSPPPPPQQPSGRPTELSSTSHSDPRDLATFPAFREFIPEIRELIWLHALPRSRLVAIHYNEQGHFTSWATIPVILSACQESRSVALKHYQLTFHASGAPPETGRIYFNPSTDIFYVPNTSHPLASGSGASHKTFQDANPDIFGTFRQSPPNLVPFTSFLTTATLLSRSSLLAVRKLAIHESVFLGTQGRWNNKALVEDHLRWFWWQVQDKFSGVEKVTFTGDEETVLEDWSSSSMDGYDEAWDEAGGGGVAVAALLAGSDGGQEWGGVFEETLYNVALRTYWDLRKQEPGWVPPRWRVWGTKEPRRVGGAGRLMEHQDDDGLGL